jgi:hypothetical protein
MVDYLAIAPLAAGVAGGVIGAVAVFLTTITGVLGYSNAAKWIETSVWKKYGYSVSWGGAVWGAVLGFVYGFVIWWIFSLVYNSLI